MEAEYLFVYGTLRKHYGSPLLDQLAEHLQHLGEGTVNGAMFDMGEYPAAVEKTGEKKIRGDVFSISDAGFCFEKLDEYEGTDYRRKLTEVSVGGGESLMAWMYWYVGTEWPSTEIVEEDYLQYLKSKKERFS